MTTFNTAEDPFAAACLGGDREAAESLLAADPDLRSAHPAMLVQAAKAGQWDVVRLLAERDFDVNTLDGGISAAHYAAAAGELALVRFLVDRGADLRARDPEFGATPHDWAKFHKRNEVVAYLASR
jgi:ankyrin repeat protein